MGLGVLTFARRYFENLCSRLKPPYVLVFDNYQEILPNRSLRKLSAQAIGISESISSVIHQPFGAPAAFASMHAGNKLSLFGWNDLKLTHEESKASQSSRKLAVRNPASMNGCTRRRMGGRRDWCFWRAR